MFVAMEQLSDGFAVRGAFCDALVRSGSLKAAGGTWNPQAKAWIFPSDRLDQVDDLYRKYLGCGVKGNDPVAKVRITLEGGLSRANHDSQNLVIENLQIAHAWGRDDGATVSSGISVVWGGFDGGGSKKNPILTAHPGTIIELTAPVLWAEKAKAAGWSVEFV